MLAIGGELDGRLAATANLGDDESLATLLPIDVGASVIMKL